MSEILPKPGVNPSWTPSGDLRQLAHLVPRLVSIRNARQARSFRVRFARLVEMIEETTPDNIAALGRLDAAAMNLLNDAADMVAAAGLSLAAFAAVCQVRPSLLETGGDKIGVLSLSARELAAALASKELAGFARLGQIK